MQADPRLGLVDGVPPTGEGTDRVPQPAVAAGHTDDVWTLQDLIALLEKAEDAKPRERGPYKKRRENLHSN